MKVLILKQALAGLGFSRELKKPLDLYGFLRKREGLIYIYGIDKRFLHYPIIGQISANGSVPDNMKIAGLIEKEELNIFYREKTGWVKCEQHVFDVADAFTRTPFAQSLMCVLEDSKVVLFGLGSMGSRLAVGLVRTGLRNLVLIDPDKFSIENISRHECDITDLDRLKVIAVKDRIQRINPFVKVDTYGFDVLHDNDSLLDDILQDASIVIATTDRNSVQLRANYECFTRKIPGLFAGCYEEARGGEVFYTIPKKTTVCLDCLRGGIQQPEKLGNIPYSKARGRKDYKGEPGLNAAINLVTDIAQQYAIALLLRNESCEMARMIDPERNLLLIGGFLGKDYYLFKRAFHFVQPVLKGPREECSTCEACKKQVDYQ